MAYIDQSCRDSHYLKQQENFKNKLRFITPENINEIDFALVRSYQCLAEVLDIMMTWSDKDAIIRNEIIRNNISSQELSSHLTNWMQQQLTNWRNQKSEDLNNELSQLIMPNNLELLSKYILSLYQGHLITHNDLQNIVLDNDIMIFWWTDEYILSDSVISLIKKLSWVNQHFLLVDALERYCKNHNDVNFANIKTLQTIINLDHDIGYATQVINSLIRLVESQEFLSSSTQINSLQEEDKESLQIQNEVEMLQIAMFAKHNKLAEQLLTSNPQLLYAQNVDGISLADLMIILLNLGSLDYFQNLFSKIISENYYYDISTEQNKNLSCSLATKFFDELPPIIYKTTNPLFDLIKKDFVLTDSFFNDKKVHILIASDEGDWSASFLELSSILHNYFPDVYFHLVNNEIWEKYDKNLLAKFDGFILPAAADRYPSQPTFKLSDMREKNFLPLNKLSIDMLKFAQEHNIPSIGSCGGAQATILASGGSLMRLDERLEDEAIEVEIKSGVVPYFMSLPDELQNSILNAQQADYPKSLIINGNINCGFVAVPNQLGENVKIAGSTTDSNHYPMCYSYQLMFATQYHPEVFYLLWEFFNLLPGPQKHYIDSFIKFARIHNEHGGEFLLSYVENIESNLRDLFGNNDEGERTVGDSQQDGEYFGHGASIAGHVLAA